jgi:hypothetical protein
MSEEIVAGVRQKYPTPLGTRHREFLDEVARALHLGLVRKTTGTFIPYPAPVNGVSQDVLMARDGRAWDVLIDGEGQARPAFNAIDPIDMGRYVEPPGGGSTEVIKPEVEVEAAGDAAAELARIRVLLTRLCKHLGVPLS